MKKGDFTFLLLGLILADEVADLSPVVASSGHEWWCYISTVRVHIGRWSGRSSPHYCLLLVKNDIFIFLCFSSFGKWSIWLKASSGEEWILNIGILSDEVADLPPSSNLYWRKAILLLAGEEWSNFSGHLILHFTVRAHIDLPPVTSMWRKCCYSSYSSGRSLPSRGF